MKKFRFKPSSHKKGCSNRKVGNPKYTRKYELKEFHSLKQMLWRPPLVEGVPHPQDGRHWKTVARFKHDGIEDDPAKWKARTSKSWTHLKFAVRLAVVTQHYSKHLDNN